MRGNMTVIYNDQNVQTPAPYMRTYSKEVWNQLYYTTIKLYMMDHGPC